MRDPLSDVLDALRITTTLYAVADLRAPWGVRFPPAPGAYFHVVAGEHCWLTLDEPEQAHELHGGDVVLMAHGSGHRLTAELGGSVRVAFDPATWVPHRLAAVSPGPGPGVRGVPLPLRAPETRLVCGAVRIRRPGSHPILRLLPAVLTVRADSAGTEELALTVRILAAETASGRPGADAVLARLGDVLLAQVLRIWAEQHGPRESGWLAAVADREIGSAVTALHADPAAAWTVESLAAVAGLSRSRFAERFTALVGRPPLAYLAAWRMTRAAELLWDTGATVRAVAHSVGYTSEPAFSRAFTRQYGVPPTRYRSTRRDAPLQEEQRDAAGDAAG